MPQPLCYSSLNTFRHPCLTTVTREIYDRLITLRDFRHKPQLWRRAWKTEREGDGAEKIKTRKTERRGWEEGEGGAVGGIDSDAGPGNNKVPGIKPNRLVSWGKKDLLCALIPREKMRLIASASASAQHFMICSPLPVSCGRIFTPL